MFGRVASFELRYQLKSPVLWITFVLFFLLTFLATTNDNVQIGAGGNGHINSPFAIVSTIGVMAILAQFVVVAFVANVVIRDWETGFGQILHATRVNKFDYLFGRFTGAFAASAIVLLSVPLAMALGSRMPWLDHERLGLFVPWHYIYAYLVTGLPTLFLCASLFFALATATRSMMASYIGLIAYIMIYIILSVVFSRPEYESIVSLLEPYGLGALFEQTKYWTAADRNTLLPPIGASYLANRAIWLTVSMLALATAYSTFTFASKGAKKAKRAESETAPPPLATVPSAAKRSFGADAAWTQVWARTRFEMAYVMSSPALLVLLAFGLLNAGAALWLADQNAAGTIVYPVTTLMAQVLRGAFAIIPVLIATYYAGELVWRDREKRVHEIVDATPAPDWTFVAPKVLALTLVLAATMAIGVTTGVIVQLLKGFTAIHLDEYFVWFVVPALFFCFAIAALAIFFQALTPHKFIGWGFMLLYLISNIVFGQMGLDHNLYLYGTTPGVPVSEMNGQGHYWIGSLWFRAYWTSLALLLVVLAYTLWRRGVDARLSPRLAALPRRLSGTAGALAGGLLLVFVGLGGWIFYNTNVLNVYRSNLDTERWTADMERALLHYENTPQPKITDVSLRIDLYPHQHRAMATGSYVIENRSSAPLTEVHLMWPELLKLERVEIDGATLAEDFATHHPAFPFQIWRFSRPMQPGERRQIHFVTRDERVGFPTNNVLSDVNDNGTFLNDRNVAPVLGFDRGVLLQDRNRRR
ncbi:MAG: aminopeptidase, partial [Proteobacteria bacterium]|nr:aminopeptidase [Pseudomonadota bacterium]